MLFAKLMILFIIDLIAFAAFILRHRDRSLAERVGVLFATFWIILWGAPALLIAILIGGAIFCPEYTIREFADGGLVATWLMLCANCGLICIIAVEVEFSDRN